MEMKHFSFLLIAMAAFALPTNAQRVEPLPIGMAPWEHALIRDYRDSRAQADRGITTPPNFPVRTMAEWEEVQGLVIAWAGYEPILKQIVRYAKEECEVIIVCDDPTGVTNYLQNSQYGGPITDMTNITLLQGDYNSVWTRDYGAECIYQNEVDSLFLLDWIYNRPRPLDDVLPDLVGGYKNIAVFSTTQAPYDLVHTGGNFMADGSGTAFSSNLVLDENGPNGQFNQTVKSSAQVDSLMHQWMGIELGRYIKMPTLPYDQIHHIDMHMKLLDEETLLVGEFPVGVSDGPQLESNIDNVTANYNSVFGTPYRVVRIPMVPSTGGQYPPGGSYRTYANNVFINRTVLVPTYREEYDTTGLRILRESLPGYKVIGIDCDNSGANIISASGAIHCITKGIGVADPLLIRHQRLRDTYETVTPYPVEAYIRHRSGIASAELYWTTDTANGFAALPMSDIGGNNWVADIPAQPAGTTIYYYVHAAAANGKEQVRPIVAPEGWWRFRVLDTNTGIGGPPAPAIAAVFPNPVSQVVVVELRLPPGEHVQVELLDALGRVALDLHHGTLPPDGRVFGDVTALAPGAYLLDVRTANGRATRRIMVR
ncbi:MAG: agmatine deiminase family protein [Flavobacteriales bacterium]|nr:agmatine deiminase family protein [Flavobacteriales bacterium]MCB9166284.1 agmatine deiminase family protein [Flavobacteriales bacterium]